MKRKDYEIKFHETDCKKRLKESVLLNFLQDIAAVDAEDIGFGYSVIQNLNIGWFLTKYHIKIFEPIYKQDKISIETVSRGALKINCFRDFDIFDSENKKIGEATSSWVVTDLNTNSVLYPEQVFKDAVFKADRQSLRSVFPKIPSPGKVDFQKIFTAGFNELDINNHVNNAVYLTWAEETLPLEILLSSRIAEIEIQYKKQVKYNERVFVSVDYDEKTNTFTEELKTENNETVCLIRQKRVQT